MSEDRLERAPKVQQLLVQKLSKHVDLAHADQSAILNVRFQTKKLLPGEDIVSQGDQPDVAVFVLKGMLGRYHTLPAGDRQYLSFHIRKDVPDVQSLFLKVMDHSVCAIDHAEIAMFAHDGLISAFSLRPNLATAFWRITLIDAAIFRQAITNNSARQPAVRLAHFFCEQYIRAREADLAEGATCSLPLNQTQLGQALGMSHISVNRAMQTLRLEKLVEFRSGVLEVLNWPALSRMAEFDPTYLYVGLKR